MNTRRAFLAGAGSLLLLGGCGFQLRGAPQLSFHNVYLSGTLEKGLASEIRTALTSEAGVTLVTRPEQADVIVTVTPLVKDKQILTLNAQGTVSQFTLLSRLNFRASDNAGNELLAPTDITISRLFNYNDVQILAKQSEEQLLYRDMQHELVQQMLRRLASIKPKANATP
jgi:LPS-assembly lipoprotein